MLKDQEKQHNYAIHWSHCLTRDLLFQLKTLTSPEFRSWRGARTPRLNNLYYWSLSDHHRKPSKEETNSFILTFNFHHFSKKQITKTGPSTCNYAKTHLLLSKWLSSESVTWPESHFIPSLWDINVHASHAKRRQSYVFLLCRINSSLPIAFLSLEVWMTV